MKNLIPHFIEQKLKSGEIQGEFKGAALFMDISGFTKITEKLMKSGSNKKEQNTEGAEILADIINSVLDPAINIIYENGGFIANFAGDAFTAIFEKQGCSNALLSAIKINLIFEKFNNLETAFGNFNLSVKIGLSFGSIKYGITGDSRKAFCFK
ncbi:adenylate/guanylate cyclase domain-containing protein, partial [Candidatus Dependentiae bacterium]|nr:adenylate/guanylate cyclase domain-containing protein [Candidatus Dependentiae bacterium]